MTLGQGEGPKLGEAQHHGHTYTLTNKNRQIVALTLPLPQLSACVVACPLQPRVGRLRLRGAPGGKRGLLYHHQHRADAQSDARTVSGRSNGQKVSAQNTGDSNLTSWLAVFKVTLSLSLIHI